MEEHAMYAVAGILVLATVCQWFAWWVKLPAILFLLLAGIIVGPVTGLIDPDELFGHLLFPGVSLAVAVILFEGSLTLRFSEIAGLEHVVWKMVSIGLVVTWAVVALASYFFVGFSVELAVLLGAFSVVTGPTVIVPLLRTVRPKARVANILRWEGIVIDPIGALLAVLVFEFIISGKGGAAFGHTLISFSRILLVGLLFGAAAGHMMGLALRHHWFPGYLQNVAVLSVVMGVFAISNAVEAEVGLLTVTVMGIYMANMKRVSLDHILDFKETLSVILISALFVILAARINFEQIEELGWGAFGVFAAIQFFARPLKVAIATWGTRLSWQERTLLGWIGPRGIVAAAIAAIFSIELEHAGYPQAALLVPLTFMIIIGTVVLQSATSGFLARMLGVAEPAPTGFLIVGANPVARVIAKALQEKGFGSVLCDTNWGHIKTARMQGLSTFYGSAVSEYADRRLNLVGLGRLLALSSQPELNVLAVHRYRREFDDKYLYVLRTADADVEGKESAPLPVGHVVFGQDVTYTRLSSAISLGAQVRDTTLTESFDFDDFYREYHGRAVPMFAIDPKNGLHVFTAETRPEPGSGWVILSLVEAAQEDEQDDASATAAADDRCEGQPVFAGAQREAHDKE